MRAASRRGLPLARDLDTPGMVRVLIERWLLPGVDEELLSALREMRRDAVHAPGYISGESCATWSTPDTT